MSITTCRQCGRPRPTVQAARACCRDRLLTDGGEETVLIAPMHQLSAKRFHRPSEADPNQPVCGQRRDDDRAYLRRVRASLAEDYQLCSRCDPEVDTTPVGGPHDHLKAALEADPDDVLQGGES